MGEERVFERVARGKVTGDYSARNIRAQLHEFSQAGFPKAVTPYWFRRGGGNEISSKLIYKE